MKSTRLLVPARISPGVNPRPHFEMFPATVSADASLLPLRLPFTPFTASVVAPVVVASRGRCVFLTLYSVVTPVIVANRDRCSVAAPVVVANRDRCSVVAPVIVANRPGPANACSTTLDPTRPDSFFFTPLRLQIWIIRMGRDSTGRAIFET